MRADILDAQRLCSFLGEMPSGLKVSEIVERLEDARERSLLIAYMALDQDSAAEQAVRDYLTKWRKVHPISTGDTLRERGLPPGPRYRSILGQLRAAWLDGKVKDQEGEARLLETLMKDQAADG